jgi:hypothetical protein
MRSRDLVSFMAPITAGFVAPCNASRIGAANQQNIVLCLGDVCCCRRAARFRSSVTRFIDPRAPHGSER